MGANQSSLELLGEKQRQCLLPKPFGSMLGNGSGDHDEKSQKKI